MTLVRLRRASMLEQPLKFFVVFFVVVEPVSLIPLFTGLTSGATSQYKRRMAFKAVTISALILVLCALGGAAFLELMGISLEAFRIFRRQMHVAQQHLLHDDAIGAEPGRDGLRGLAAKFVPLSRK